jgi:type II secretory pathway component PulF
MQLWVLTSLCLIHRHLWVVSGSSFFHWWHLLVGPLRAQLTAGLCLSLLQHSVIPRGSLSLKVLAELPIIVVLMYQVCTLLSHFGFFLIFFFWLSLGGTGVWARGLTLARQVLYHILTWLLCKKCSPNSCADRWAWNAHVTGVVSSPVPLVFHVTLL